eukprot:jgi/Botrbrau1/5811/Bobra.0155s0033.1
MLGPPETGTVPRSRSGSGTGTCAGGASAGVATGTLRNRTSWALEDPTPQQTTTSMSRLYMAVRLGRYSGDAGGQGASGCQRFLQQAPIPAKAPPHGNRTCLFRCQNAGVCNHDTGMCDCIAGYTGEHCQLRQKRTCAATWRSHGLEQAGPIRPADSLWPPSASRCMGVCDEDIGACLCNGTYGRIPRGRGSKPTDPPRQVGRPLMLACLPRKDEMGRPNSYGQMEPEDLWGPGGWCVSPQPRVICPCMLDGWVGPYCDQPAEQFCLNQCSGNGECRSGFCLCYDGFYGHDCARWRPGIKPLPDPRKAKPWLKPVFVPPPSAGDPPPSATRLRPLIYVYDLPADYNTRLLQYRFPSNSCGYRLFAVNNESMWTRNTYCVETLLHEMLLQSAHRTLDPEEADFFYVPLYTSCYAHPVHGWGTIPGTTDPQSCASGTWRLWHWRRSGGWRRTCPTGGARGAQITSGCSPTTRRLAGFPTKSTTPPSSSPTGAAGVRS